MIQANELRRGNILNFNGIELPVTGILGHGLMYGGLSVPSSFDSSSPIPLTEEWLMKFGFEIQHDDSNYIAYLDNFRIKKGYFDKLHIWQYGYLDTYTEDFKNIDVNYIHVLQNLYFALTGQELNYAK